MSQLNVNRSLLNPLFWLFGLLFLTSSAVQADLPKAEVVPNSAIKLTTQIDALNISGVVITEDFMALATDEGQQLELFKQTSSGQWQSHQVITLTKDSAEIDLEALAWQEPYLYALGSHSAKRKKIDNDKSQKQNVKRISDIYPETARQVLFRVELDSDLKTKSIKTLSLQPLIEDSELIAPFSGLPSKENGIDLEGLAIDEKGRLLIGFRGPVLRGNIVPSLRIKPSKKKFNIKKHQWLFLHAEGRGVRGLSETKSGFLVLTGAVGDQPLSYQIGLWDGENALESKNAPKDSVQWLCELPAIEGKPEGIQTISESKQNIRFTMVADGLKSGAPTTYECALP